MDLSKGLKALGIVAGLCFSAFMIFVLGLIGTTLFIDLELELGKPYLDTVTNSYNGGYGYVLIVLLGMLCILLYGGLFLSKRCYDDLTKRGFDG